MHHYRCQNVYISTTASDRIVDTLELFPHTHQMPQLKYTDRLLMAARDMTEEFQNPHPAVPFACVGDGFSSNFQTQITTLSVPRDSSFACQSRYTPNHHSLTNPNLELTHSQPAANDITDDNSHSKYPICAITSEGGHTSVTTCITTKGAQ
jgi:hypothetical protein